jgi:hypothetical protein
MAGETTTALSANPPYAAAEGMFLVPFTVAYATGQLEANDVLELGYLPANCTVYGVIYSPTDMDTNVSPGLVQKITIGSTDVATGLTGGQTGAKSFVGVVPTTLTEKTLAKVTTTTAAATAAAGTLYCAFLCQK